MADATSNRIQGLDLLRGLAILLVITHHAWPVELGSGGIVGVVAFFTLSGYLITGVLQRDIARNGRVRYGHFYRNRAIRLIPALLLFLAVFAIYTIVVNPYGDRNDVLRSILVAITYSANIPFDHGSPAISHLWTLATEEQFYLVWPLLLTVALRWKMLRLMVLGAAVILMIACVASVVVTAPAVHRVYTLPSSWAIAMVVGAGAKIGEAKARAALARWSSSVPVLGTLGAAALIGLSFLPEAKGSPVTYIAGGPLIAALTVAVIFLLSTWRTIPHAYLRPLLALGTISYAAYLWNWPIVLWLGQYTDGVAKALLSIALTIAAAAVSWWSVERPTNAWKARLDTRSQKKLQSAIEGPHVSRDGANP
jgi:peptidoglycan/LPS O-acetylase OafA/YrhL